MAFLETLTDGYNPANPTVSTYKNIDTFTGQCSATGGPARRHRTRVMRPIIPTWEFGAIPLRSRYLRCPAAALAADPIGPTAATCMGAARPPYSSGRLPKRERQLGVC